MATAPSLQGVDGDPIDLVLDPPLQVAREGELVEILLVARGSGAPQTFVAIDAILEWDPAKLEFIGAVDGGFPWLVADFLNDPDGLNLDLSDGQALFTALAQPDDPPTLPNPPPDGAEIKVIFAVFRAWSSGTLRLRPNAGTIARTRVISHVPGFEVTGNDTDIAQVIVAPGDVDHAPVPPGQAPDRMVSSTQELVGVPALEPSALLSLLGGLALAGAWRLRRSAS